MPSQFTRVVVTDRLPASSASRGRRDQSLRDVRELVTSPVSITTDSAHPAVTCPDHTTELGHLGRWQIGLGKLAK